MNPLDIDEIKDIGGIWYVASPYTRYPDGTTEAFLLASQATAKLVASGICAYSPIAHGHPLSVIADLDPEDQDMWMFHCLTMLEKAEGLIVLGMDGWDESTGVEEEIAFCRERDIPVYFMEWP